MWMFLGGVAVCFLCLMGLGKVLAERKQQPVLVCRRFIIVRRK